MLFAALGRQSGKGQILFQFVHLALPEADELALELKDGSGCRFRGFKS